MPTRQEMQREPEQGRTLEPGGLVLNHGPPVSRCVTWAWPWTSVSSSTKWGQCGFAARNQ